MAAADGCGKARRQNYAEGCVSQTLVTPVNTAPLFVAGFWPSLPARRAQSPAQLPQTPTRCCDVLLVPPADPASPCDDQKLLQNALTSRIIPTQISAVMPTYPPPSDGLLRAVSPNAIIAAKLSALVHQAADLAALHPALFKSLRDVEQLTSGLEPYLATCTTPESSDLSQLVAATQSTDWKARYASGDTSIELESEMVSGHVEGQFLKMLVGISRATRILEIGLFTGYSALAMAEALPEHGRLVACEIDGFAADFARAQFARSRHGHKISVEVGHAAATMQRLSDAHHSFDLIFIDADKSAYESYYNLALTGTLLAPNGLICVDNTLMQGWPYLPGQLTGNGLAIADFNRKVAADPRVEQVVLPLRDGLTLIRRSPS